MENQDYLRLETSWDRLVHRILAELILPFITKKNRPPCLMFCTRWPMEKSTKEFQDCCFQILLLLICGAWCSMVPLCPIATLLVMLRLRGFLHAFGKPLITSNSSNSVELQRFYAPENPPEILWMIMLGSFHQQSGCLGSPVCSTALLESYKFAIQIHIPLAHASTPSQIELGAVEDVEKFIISRRIRMRFTKCIPSKACFKMFVFLICCMV